jgi:hypothetical protein
MHHFAKAIFVEQIHVFWRLRNKVTMPNKIFVLVQTCARIKALNSEITAVNSQNKGSTSQEDE